MSVYIFKQPHTAPEIISLDEAKKHLKVDFTDDDTLISDMILAAVEHAENYTGTDISEAEYEVHFDEFIQDYELKLSPVQSIQSITYTPESGGDQTISEMELLPVDKFASKIHYTDVDNLPAIKEGTRIKVSILTGYADGKTPKAIRNAIKLIIGNLYEVRQDGVFKFPTRAENLLSKYRFYY